VRVRQAIAGTAEGLHEKTPKTTAGVRDVETPPHILPALREHMLAHAEQGANGLVFPARSGGHLAPPRHNRAPLPGLRSSAARSPLGCPRYRAGVVGSATTKRTSDPSDVLNAVCREGGELVNGSFVFVEEGQQSRDKFMASGQNVAIKGTTVGYYLLKRNPDLRVAPGTP